MNRKIFFACLLCLCLSLVGIRSIAYAEGTDDIYVSSWTELQNAVDHAADGQVIKLSQSVINRNGEDRIKVSGKAITIDLAGQKLDRNLSSEKADGHVIEVFAGAQLIIRDSSPEQAGTIMGGHSKRGGGIYVNEDATLVIESGTISGNEADVDGGGIYVAGILMMTGGTIANNEAGDTGGGIYVYDTGSFKLINAEITHNTAKNIGGGINMHMNRDSLIRDCKIHYNTCHDIGGGLRMAAQGRTLDIDNTIIDNNTSEDDGAGIYLERGTINMFGGSLSNNITDNNSGGAKARPNTFFTADSVMIRNNRANTEEGGGLKNQGTMTLRNCQISGNYSEKPGGGIFNDNDGDSEGNLTIENGTIDLNFTNSNGGGIYSDKKLTLKGSSADGLIITQNEAGDGRGNGVFIGKDSDPTYIEGKVVVQNNQPSENGQEVFLRPGQRLNLSGPLSQGTMIGITMEDGDGYGTFTSGYRTYNSDTNPAIFFFSPDNLRIASVRGGNERGEVCIDGKPWKRDYEFAFGNSSSHFNTGTYTILDSDFQKLCMYLDKMGCSSRKDKIQKERKDQWGGSCLGIAVSSILDYTSQIGFNENFDPGKKKMNDVSSPKSNQQVMSAINYYYMSQFIPKVYADEEIYSNTSSDWKYGLSDLVDNAQSGKVMLFSYFFKRGFDDEGKPKTHGHGVVVTGYDGTDSEGNHRLVAYDSRYPGKDTIVTVSEDYSKCIVNGRNPEDAYKIEITVDFSAYDKMDIDGPYNDMVIEDFRNSAVQSASQTEIYVPSEGNITIENEDGKRMRVSDGLISDDSTMEVVKEHMIIRSTGDEDDASAVLAITVEDSDSFIFSSESENIDVSVLGDRYYSDVTAVDAESVKLSQAGTILYGNKVVYTVTQSINSQVCDMFSCTGTTNGNGTIKFADNKITIKGHDGGNIIIEEFFNGKTEKFSVSSDQEDMSIQLPDYEELDPCKNGHDWGAWVTVKNPTATSHGLKKRICKNDSSHVQTLIIKANNPLKIKVSKKTFKRNKLKKAKTFKIGVSKGKGKVTYTLDKKAKKAKIRVSAKGKVTIPKKCRKGTYKIIVKATGNRYFKAGKKTVKIVVK